MANNRIVGALWEKHKDGNAYYSGVLRDLHGDINIAVFPNNKKEKPNQPDMNIVLSFANKNGKELAEPVKKGKKKAKTGDDEPTF